MIPMNQRFALLAASLLLASCGAAPPAASTSDLADPPEPSGPAVRIEPALSRLAPGSVLRVGARRVCGFSVDSPVFLDGRGATIVACDSSPGPVDALPQLTAGIFLRPTASGSAITGFRFEGRGVTDGAPGALAFGVFSRGAEFVVVEHNRFDGTVQAVTDNGGRGWLIDGNRVRGLEVFGCPGTCGGGDAIVLAHSRVSDASADDAFVTSNDVRDLPPPSDLIFSVTGVLAYAVRGPFILNNTVSLPGSPTIGIEYTRTAGGVLIDVPCGGGRIIGNHVRHADTAILVTDDCAADTIVEGNRTGTGMTPLPTTRLIGAPAPQPLGLD